MKDLDREITEKVQLQLATIAVGQIHAMIIGSREGLERIAAYPVQDEKDRDAVRLIELLLEFADLQDEKPPTANVVPLRAVPEEVES